LVLIPRLGKVEPNLTSLPPLNYGSLLKSGMSFAPLFLKVDKSFAPLFLKVDKSFAQLFLKVEKWIS